MIDCVNCEIRKFYANAYDVHFDYKDCPIPCKAKKREKEKNQKHIIDNGKDYEFER